MHFCVIAMLFFPQGTLFIMSQSMKIIHYPVTLWDILHPWSGLWTDDPLKQLFLEHGLISCGVKMTKWLPDLISASYLTPLNLLETMCVHQLRAIQSKWSAESRLTYKVLINYLYPISSSIICACAYSLSACYDSSGSAKLQWGCNIKCDSVVFSLWSPSSHSVMETWWRQHS